MRKLRRRGSSSESVTPQKNFLFFFIGATNADFQSGAFQQFSEYVFKSTVQRRRVHDQRVIALSYAVRVRASDGKACLSEIKV